MGCLRKFGIGRVNLIAPWYIATPLMSAKVVEHLKKDMAREGSDFAKVEDCAKAGLRLASDHSVNGMRPFSLVGLGLLTNAGRSIFICPTTVDPNGYMDLNLDDFSEDSLMFKLQKICSGFTHRRLPAAQQAV